MQSNGLNSALSPAEYGDIALTIKNKCTQKYTHKGVLIHFNKIPVIQQNISSVLVFINRRCLYFLYFCSMCYFSFANSYYLLNEK